MRSFKILTFCLIVAFFSACSSSSKNVSPGDANIPLATEGKELKDINFGYDSYELDNASKLTLQANVSWLQENSKIRVQVEGHCDDRGTNEYNMVLGANRARAAYDYMRSLGIDSTRMSTVSYGEELPLDAGEGEVAWAKNRRVHFNY